MTIEHLYASGRRPPSRFRPSTLHERDDAGFLAGLAAFGASAAELLTHPELGPLLLPRSATTTRRSRRTGTCPGRR